MTETAHVTVEVEVDPATAFDLFTRDIAAWWRADRSLWGDTDGELRFENGLLMQGSAEIGRVSACGSRPSAVALVSSCGTAAGRKRTGRGF